MTYPFSPLVALVVAGILLCLARGRRLRGAGIALFVTGYLGSTPLVANLLVGSLEARAEPAVGECGRLDAVVLLSGGLQREPRDADDVRALTARTQERILALVERDDPDIPLLLAGGGPFAVSEAEVMQSLLRRLAPSRAVAALETRSRTTWENAVETARLLPPPRHLGVATSAVHLPRARLAFEAQGYSVCPWPLDRMYVAARGPGVVLPHASAVLKTESALHEIGGHLAYRWRESSSN